MGENSILTQTQRGFLRMGEEERAQEYSKQQRHYHRKSIQTRLRWIFDDLKLLLEAGAGSVDIGLESTLADTDPGRVWPLPALLFVWAIEHPTYLNRHDVVENLSSPDGDTTLESQMERITTSFDSQVERGVRAAIEFGDSSFVPEDVSNELTIDVGEPAADMDDEELASLPRHTLDLLFRRGDLDSEGYARVMELKLDDEE